MATFRNIRISFFLFWLIVSVMFGLLFVAPEFYNTPIAGIKDFSIALAQWGLIMVVSSAVIGLLCVSRRVAIVMLPLLFLLCATATYFRITMDMALTPQIIELAAINDTRTCMSVVSLPLILTDLAAVVIAGLMAWVRLRNVRQPLYWAWISYGVVILIGIAVMPQRIKSPIMERLPYSMYNSIRLYYINKKEALTRRPAFDHVSASCNTDTITVVMIIGESLRADHLGINGYHRQTTPLLSTDTAVISLPYMYTEPCYTHTSVPRIMTRGDVEHPDRDYEEPSFITLLNKAGFKTSWLANQEMVPTYSYFMHEADELSFTNRNFSLYSYDKWLDEELLPLYAKSLSADAHRKFILLHSIGSHWWYPSHFTDDNAIFQPIIKSKVVSANSAEAMINSYDNCIISTDRFVMDIIRELRDKKAVLIYVSDHGESLGEDGVWLHGIDRQELHNPACLIWYSDKYAKAYPRKIANLKRNSNTKHTTDDIFHSMLDAADVKTSVLTPSKSIFYHE